MTINPPTQYADDRNLRARQRLWEHQRTPFDLVGWVLELAGIEAADRVLDVGCGNGIYLDELHRRGIDRVGCDLSIGMLQSGSGLGRVNGDVTRLPFGVDTFDVVLAPHMLYHVSDRVSAAREVRRVLRPGGTFVAVTNGARHLRGLRDLVEAAARKSNRDWEMRNPSTHEFSLENGADQLRVAFGWVEVVRPTGVEPAAVRDASVAADYVASIEDHYSPQVDRPWTEVVDEVRAHVQSIIDAEGAFTVGGDVGALVCR